ncbi:activating molecule in becn1-regulated autophagy protein 1 [Phtheirospermum japonicum]|uniref:Activating molecule in becn1-regulated autophagy protein 1 n=1 Tax=Phtheirospermum japonicum TaxID=374723 RepID=A0A830B803_9LAMI|nr:activating molecule in becn1-regulated autophagy protein 1 [Phtheirospermum japonicum]
MRSSSTRADNSASATAAPPPPSNSLPEMSSGQSNVYKLLAQRELSPQTKRTPKRFWGKASRGHVDSSGIKSELAKDARQELRSWAEAESLLHLSAKYCSLVPPPRSTIAAAFSPDGNTLASTHGDHTVKIIDCRTGTCLKVLTGHRRTPWVVRFHPLYPEVVASGSLDHEVRLWDAKTAACVGSHRPIASIAFHAQGEFLAVASGHKLYIWHYNRRGEASSPIIILRTRRSLRAVHFHPHGAPFLLTAEVNDLDSSDPMMTLATSPGYSRYPSPTIYVADANPGSSGNDLHFVSMPFLIFPSVSRGGGPHPTDDVDSQRRAHSSSVRLLTYSTPSGQYELVLSPIQSPARDEPHSNNNNNNSLTSEIDNSVSHPVVDPMETEEVVTNQFFPFGDPAHWELPFLQGWLIGQSQVGQQATQLQNGVPAFPNVGDSRNRSSRSRTRPSSDPTAFNGIRPEQSNSQVQPEAAAELPCTVKLRIWSHDMKNACAPLDAERCRLTITHAVLCSEMGAHFSPCGRFLAACVACILPSTDADPVSLGQAQNDVTGASTSPTRHPIAAHQVVYELRIYSLEEATFGSVLASRAIRAAHCLTSIQFSPTSEHLLLAYGRRHTSLLKSVVIDGDMTVSIYTILEIYRVSDMELVRVLPSADDEVNVASFHPSVGGGFIYGTKEGKLRILQCDSSHGFHNDSSSGSDSNMPEGWYFDSGCSHHMTSTREYLTDFETYDRGKVIYGGGAMEKSSVKRC